MNEKTYWIWLQQALKYGSHKVRVINLLYGSVQDFYDAGEREWRLCGWFSNKEIDALNFFNIKRANATVARCNELGLNILTLSDKDYPERLKNIPNPPCALYIKGELPQIDDEICISIVGTRNATEYGKQMSYELSSRLAQKKAVIVSGGAIGVDTAAHQGAIDTGGKTLAILGCGVNFPYLSENEQLRNKISKFGALISEYPPDFPASRSNFPIRNRIISGLSLGTVVIEAGEKSGSLITANLANDQNRDVFVVPVDMRSPVSKGTVSLIRDGAKVITCADDILNEYKKVDVKPVKSFVKKLEHQNTKKSHTLDNEKINLKIYPKDDVLLSGVSSEAKLVYDTLQKGKLHIDEISSVTKILTKNLLPLITELEISGLIKSNPGKIYEIN